MKKMRLDSTRGKDTRGWPNVVPLELEDESDVTGVKTG